MVFLILPVIRERSAVCTCQFRMLSSADDNHLPSTKFCIELFAQETNHGSLLLPFETDNHVTEESFEYFIFCFWRAGFYL